MTTQREVLDRAETDGEINCGSCAFHKFDYDDPRSTDLRGVCARKPPVFIGDGEWSQPRVGVFTSSCGKWKSFL